MPLNTVLSVTNVSFRYNGLDVLEDVTFAVDQGDYVALVGPNGSGKTTLARLILGIEKPHTGRITLYGTPVDSYREWHRIGFLPQRLGEMNARFPATVGEVVAMGLLSGKVFPRRLQRRDRERVKEVLHTLAIADLIDVPVGQLSGGQLQRVLLAKALVGSPELLILDEPTTALDPEMRDRFFEILEDANRRMNTTVLIITHDVGIIGRYASKLLYIDKRVFFYGTMQEFCESLEITRLFGSFSQHIICHRHD
ncbi:MAG: metal ABC transporter ATP-binding protein [Syntrophales bacterium]|nr:metal ABC transporter ATP-binding protein [Syntrophales bacterium]